MDKIYRPTDHGENIARIIPEEDPYGDSGILNPADVLLIVDAMHSNLIKYTTTDPLTDILSRWADEISTKFDIET